MERNKKKAMVQSQIIQQHIPHEIIAEILSRLPVKSLIRFTCVSKEWQSLISDPKFNLSMNGRERGFFYLKALNGKIPFFSVDNDLAVQKLPSPSEDCVPEKFFTFYGSCNGLLLFRVFPSIYLWNPSTRWCRELLRHDFLGTGFHINISGLCYDDSTTDDYKLLISFQHGSKVDKNFVLVIGLRSNEWTKVRFPYATVRHGCFANGRLHWIVQKYSNSPHQIVYFDTKSSDFIELPKPKPSIGIDQLGVLDGCLSLSDGRKILIMREYGVKESWTTIFERSRCLSCCCIREKGESDGEFVEVPGFGITTSKELLVAKFRHAWHLSVWDMVEDNVFGNSNLLFNNPGNPFLIDHCLWETYYESLACPDTRTLVLDFTGDQRNLSVKDSMP